MGFGTGVDRVIGADDAMARYLAGDFEGAVLAARARLSAGRDACAFLVVARVANHFGAFREALEFATDAARADGADASCLAQLAYQRMQLSDLSGARDAALRVLAIGGGDAEAFDLAGAVFHTLGDFTDAARVYERAAGLDPDNATVRTNLGSVLTLCGDTAGAQAAYRAALAIEPYSPRALAALSEIRKASSQDNNLDLIRAAIGTARSPGDSLTLHHALSRELEAVGDFAGALAALRAGKGDMIAGLGRSLNDDDAMFGLLATLAGRTDGKTGTSDGRPIFIVGAPRSGTTLLERILTNGTDVFPLGESPVLPTLVRQATGTDSRHLVDARALVDTWADIDFDAIGRAYMAQTAERSGGRRTVDKLPLNALLIAVILKALPQARIIRTGRDHDSATIGNYRQMFEFDSGTYDYSLALDRTSRFLSMLDTHLDAANAQHPHGILKVELEKLVEQPAAIARRICEFCQIEWHQGVEKVEDNQYPVGSASAVQARMPINRSADSITANYRALLVLEPRAQT